MELAFEVTGHLNGHSAPAICLDVNAAGDTLISGSEDGCVRVWDVSRAVSTRALMPPQADKASCSRMEIGAACAGHGHTEHCVLFSAGSTLYAFDLRTPGVVLRQPHGNFMVNEDDIAALTLDDVGGKLAAADDSGEIQVLDFVAGELYCTLDGGHANICSCVAYRPHRAHELYSGGLDAVAVRWDTQGPELLESWSFAPRLGETPSQLLNPRHVHSLGFTPDGAALAIALGDGSIEVLDAVSGQLLGSAEAHRCAASQVLVIASRAPSTGGAAVMMVSAGDDCEIRLWEARRTAPTPSPEHAHFNYGDALAANDASGEGGGRLFTLQPVADMHTNGKPNSLVALSSPCIEGQLRCLDACLV